jgi:hypothetical protein
MFLFSIIKLYVFEIINYDVIRSTNLVLLMTSESSYSFLLINNRIISTTVFHHLDIYMHLT